MLAGIGFTVALFVTELAYAGNEHAADTAKLGILLASFIAGVIGFTVLRNVTHVPEETSKERISSVVSEPANA